MSLRRLPTLLRLPSRPLTRSSPPSPPRPPPASPTPPTDPSPPPPPPTPTSAPNPSFSPTVSLFLNPTASFHPRTPALRNSTALIVKGPLGQLSLDILPFLKLSLPSNNNTDGGKSEPKVLGDIAKEAFTVSSAKVGKGEVPVAEDGTCMSRSRGVERFSGRFGEKQQRAMWGLTRALIANAVVGVSEGHTATIQMVGVGYRAELEETPAPPGLEVGKKGQRLNLRLGFSNPVVMDAPKTDTFLGVKVLGPTQLEIRGVDKREVGQFAASIRKWRKPEPYNGKGIFVNGETIRRKEVKKK